MSVDELDISQLKSLESVEEEIVKRKDSLHKKVKSLKDLEQAKKDMVASYKEPISLAKEEVKATLEILDELNSRRLELEATKKLA